MTTLYYHRISVSEGIDIENPWENHDDLINEVVSRRCNGCRVLFFKDLNSTIEKGIDMLQSLLGTDFEPMILNLYNIVE